MSTPTLWLFCQPNDTRRETIVAAERLALSGDDALCVLPTWVADAIDHCPTVATVIGWPYGAAAAQAKAIEAATAAADGAQILLLYPNLSALKSGAELIVAEELQSVVEMAEPAGATVALVLPWTELKPFERQQVARIAMECGAEAVVLPVAEKESADALRAFLPEEVALWVQVRSDDEAATMTAAGAERLLREVPRA